MFSVSIAGVAHSIRNPPFAILDILCQISQPRCVRISDTVEFGLVIIDQRKRQNLSQHDVATATGTTRQAIAALEQNRGRVSTLATVLTMLRLRPTGLAPGLTIVDQIVATRQDRGWSLRKVAEQSQLSVNTVRNLEAGIGSIGSLIVLIDVLAPECELKKVNGGIPTVVRSRSLARNKLDYYATPQIIVRLLLENEYFDPEQIILEPTVGKARSIDIVLRQNGFQTRCYDISGIGSEKRDFFELTERFHTIVTNPPFSHHREFILHAKRIATDKIACLLPINYLTGTQRHSDLWQDAEFPLARCLVINRGIDFKNSDPTSDKFRSAQIYCGWYIFERGHIGPPVIKWIDADPFVERAADRRRDIRHAK